MTKIHSRLPTVIDSETARALLLLSSWRTVILQRRGQSIRIDVYRGSGRARIRIYEGRAHRSRPKVDISLDGWEFRGLLRARIFRSSIDLERRLEARGFIHRIEEHPDRIVLVWEPLVDRFKLQPLLRGLPTVPIVEKSSNTYTITLDILEESDVRTAGPPGPRGINTASVFAPGSRSPPEESDADFWDEDSDVTIPSTSFLLEAKSDVSIGPREDPRGAESDVSLSVQDASELKDSDVTFRARDPVPKTDVTFTSSSSESWTHNRRQDQYSRAGHGVETDVALPRVKDLSAKEFLEAFAVGNPWDQVLASKKEGRT